MMTPQRFAVSPELRIKQCIEMGNGGDYALLGVNGLIVEGMIQQTISRISKSEIRNNTEIQIFKIKSKLPAHETADPFWSFVFWSFEFVSCFDIRISDFRVS
ncbi:MAG: hypothetical protein CVU57_14820, partial [Deltaproteobacteria bacterium HGW-Deltaproteobacteria-15]